MKTLFKSDLLKFVVIFLSALLISSVPECPPPYGSDNVVYLINPESCNTFYECSNGEPILVQCPEAILCWDSRIEACNFCWEVDCAGRSEMAGYTTGYMTDGTTFIPCCLLANYYYSCGFGNSCMHY